MGWLSKIPVLNKLLQPRQGLVTRELRLGLRHADVYFRPQHADLSGIINVINISNGGLALDKNFTKHWPEEGEVIPGKLFMRDNSFDVCCKIIHKAGDVVGCEFIERPDDFAQKYSDFLNVELSAHSLVQIQDQILKEDIPGTAFYFHSKDQNELYFVFHEGRVSFFSVVLFGQFLSGGDEQSLRSGTVIKEVSDKVHGYKRIDPVSWSKSVAPDLISQAIRFIDNIEGLQTEPKSQLLQKLKQHLQS